MSWHRNLSVKRLLFFLFLRLCFETRGKFVKTLTQVVIEMIIQLIQVEKVQDYLKM